MDITPTQYREALQKMFDTSYGEVVLEKWKRDYIRTSCFPRGVDTNTIIFNAGLREFVQDILNKLEEELPLEGDSSTTTGINVMTEDSYYE